LGLWREAYIEKKDAEPNYGDPNIKSSLRKCKGVMDREGKCENVFRSVAGIYCDECRKYFNSGEWKFKYAEKLKMNQTIINYFEQREALFKAINDNYLIRDSIEEAALMIHYALKNNQTIFICGNGGSASQSAHFAGEMLNWFTMERTYALPAIDLTAHVATITAIGNDYKFDEVFAKPLAGLGRSGDVLIGLSTSGKSKNVNMAIDHAGYSDIRTIYLTGNMLPDGCNPDLLIQIPSNETALIQEGHLAVLHLLCKLIDQHLLEDSKVEEGKDMAVLMTEGLGLENDVMDVDEIVNAVEEALKRGTFEEGIAIIKSSEEVYTKARGEKSPPSPAPCD
jgi:D-sedoheptulose 7-phosphate isomerase